MRYKGALTVETVTIITVSYHIPRLSVGFELAAHCCVSLSGINTLYCHPGLPGMSSVPVNCVSAWSQTPTFVHPELELKPIWQLLFFSCSITKSCCKCKTAHIIVFICGGWHPFPFSNIHGVNCHVGAAASLRQDVACQKQRQTHPLPFSVHTRLSDSHCTCIGGRCGTALPALLTPEVSKSARETRWGTKTAGIRSKFAVSHGNCSSRLWWTLVQSTEPV